MPKDFAKLNRPIENSIPVLKSETQSIPVWVWIIGALLIGNMLLFVVKYNKKLNVFEPVASHIEPVAQVVEITESVTASVDSSPPATETTTVTQEDKGDGKVSEKVVEKPDLDFYVELAKVDVLGEIEAPASVKRKPTVEATKKNNQEQTTTKSTATQTKPLQNTGYLLQVSSFKSSNDAERLLGRLKKSGFSEAYIQAAQINGTIWHRVMLGQYGSFAVMDSKRKALKLLGFDSMQITLKQ